MYIFTLYELCVLRVFHLVDLKTVGVWDTNFHQQTDCLTSLLTVC